MGTNVQTGAPVAGGFWWVWYLALALLAVAVFTRAPSVLTGQEVKLPPAYELKAQRPFADTSKLTVPEDPGERSHGAKLTPRLVGSIVLHWAKKFSWHPYLPAMIFGMVFLFSGIRIGYQIAGDRLVGLYLALTYAGLYSAAACFAVNWAPKPFDGIAMGLLGLTMLSIRRPWVMAGLAFLACWTDERCIVSLLLIAFFVYAWPTFSRREALHRCFILAVSIGVYLATRLLLAMALDWGTPDLSMIRFSPPLALLVLQLVAWSCFEGGWIAIIMAVVVLAGRQDHVSLGLLVGAVAVAIGSCLIVLDVSRASGFAFPLIPAAYGLLKRCAVTPRELRIVAGAGAAASLLVPTFEVITGVTVTWLPSYLSILLQ